MGELMLMSSGSGYKLLFVSYVQSNGNWCSLAWWLNFYAWYNISCKHFPIQSYTLKNSLAGNHNNKCN